MNHENIVDILDVLYVKLMRLKTANRTCLSFIMSPGIEFRYPDIVYSIKYSFAVDAYTTLNAMITSGKYSFQPLHKHSDDKGRVKLDDVVTFFRSYYEGRRSSGLIVEKKNSTFAKGGYTNGEAARNILSNPFKRFEDMQMMRHTKTLGIIQIDESVWKQLTTNEKAEIAQICDEKIAAYYDRLSNYNNEVNHYA